MTRQRRRLAPAAAAALRYAQAGWPVFPCRPGEKIPATAHGFLDATTDPDQITWWWRRDPGRNVAIATGLPGPDVLDVDVRPGGNGFTALARLRRDGLLDPAAAFVRTPSGGLHAYFTGSQQGNGRLPAHHLDFRSVGGYIVAPPSQVGGRRYELIGHREPRPGQHQGQSQGLDWAAVTRLLDPQPQRFPARDRDRRGDPARAFDPARLAGWVARLAEGNRNDGLFWAASRALESGLTDLDELAEAARRTGLGDREIARTLASAQRHASASTQRDTRASTQRHADASAQRHAAASAVRAADPVARPETPAAGRDQTPAAEPGEPEHRSPRAQAPEPDISAREQEASPARGPEAEVSGA